MHNCGDEVRGPAKRIGYQPAIDAFIRAVEACPERRDSRHPDKEPILEPHYKLLSVVHKLVRLKRVSVGSSIMLSDTLLTHGLSPKRAVISCKQLHTPAKLQTSKERKAGMDTFGGY